MLTVESSYAACYTVWLTWAPLVFWASSSLPFREVGQVGYGLFYLLLPKVLM